MLSADTIYVQMFRDRFIVKNVDSGESAEVKRDMSYASPRMLIGDFTTAQYQLQEAVKTVKEPLNNGRSGMSGQWRPAMKSERYVVEAL